MSIQANREVNGLIGNLKNSLHLLTFRQITIDRYYVSVDQSVLLVFVFAIITFVGSYILSLPKPEISIYGLANIATQAFLLLFAAYVISKISKTEKLILPLFIAFLSLWSWFYIGWLVFGKSNNFSYWEFFGDKKYQYLFYNIWIAAVFVTTASRIIGNDKVNVLKILTTYLVLVAIPLQYLTFGAFWHLAYNYEDEYAKYKSINEEYTYYRQFELIEASRENILPERSGISDIYFVGFGSYASQDVFMKEVLYARDVFDDRYDTKDRSVALINNIKTLKETPLATKNNLDLLIRHIGSLINPEEDFLFLYLTSHGSKQQQLSVELMPLSLNKVGPQELKRSLDSSGIRYRVLLISSCYSGGFIEPLKDDYTVIVTASASDKKSFGCGSKSDFTYFGKALFEEQLRHNYNFIDAFERAIQSIQRREQAEKIEPSDPQLFVGKMVRAKLEELSREIAVFNQKKELSSGSPVNDT